MDAAAQLALIAKAKRVFESAGTFLSFPLASTAFAPAVLDFGKAYVDPKIGAALLEFSRTVNQCPDGVIFRGDSDQYLWDHYDNWLNGMLLAQGGLSAAQEVAYAQARALLTATDANGLLTDSPALTAYKQYRDEYINTEQTYKSAQITALTGAPAGTEAAAQAQWERVDEPRLRQLVAQAEAEWKSKGGKSAIEAAQATISTCEARVPQKAWDEWRSAYNPDLDLFTDPISNGSCGPSGFAPADICAQAWTTFTLTQTEIQALTAEAPPELRTIFGQTGTSEIASLSFDFRSAAVVRKWFNSAALEEARFWKFGDGAADLSDGNSPPNGAWPAYVSAVIFARNIQVTVCSAPKAPPQPVETLPPIVLRAGVLQAMQAQRAATFVRPPATAMTRPSVAAQPMAKAQMSASNALPAAQLRMAAAPVAHAAAPAATAARSTMRLQTAMYRLAPDQGTTAVSVGLPAQTGTTQTYAGQPQADDKISILALICRPLRKVPNPDPALHW
jgi:hypothetical protein